MPYLAPRPNGKSTLLSKPPLASASVSIASTKSPISTPTSHHSSTSSTSVSSTSLQSQPLQAATNAKLPPSVPTGTGSPTVPSETLPAVGSQSTTSGGASSPGVMPAAASTTSAATGATGLPIISAPLSQAAHSQAGSTASLPPRSSNGPPSVAPSLPTVQGLTDSARFRPLDFHSASPQRLAQLGITNISPSGTDELTIHNSYLATWDGTERDRYPGKRYPFPFVVTPDDATKVAEMIHDTRLHRRRPTVIHPPVTPVPVTPTHKTRSKAAVLMTSMATATTTALRGRNRSTSTSSPSTRKVRLTAQSQSAASAWVRKQSWSRLVGVSPHGNLIARAPTQIFKTREYLALEPNESEWWLLPFLSRWPNKRKSGSVLLPVDKLELPREKDMAPLIRESESFIRDNYDPAVVLTYQRSFYKLLLRHTATVTLVLPSRGRQPPSSVTKQILQGFSRQRHSISGATAALLIHHVSGRYYDECVCDRFLGVAGELVWREIRTARLGGYIEERVLGRYLRGEVTKAAKDGYELCHNSIGQCHDIAVSILHSFHSDSIHKAGMALQSKVDHMCSLLEWGKGLTRRRTAGIRLIALQQALAYASLVGLLKDILKDSIQHHNNAEAAFAALTTAVSAGAGAASAMVGSGAERLVVASVDGAGSVLHYKLKTKHAAVQERYRRLIVDVVDKFNVEVLLQADCGNIRSLDIKSPPSDPDGLQLGCPDRYLISRPTPYDISIFKQTAINAFLAATRREGVKLSQESGRPAVTSPFNDPLSRVTLGELLAYGGHSLAAKPNRPHFAEHILQTELDKHFPPDQVDDWYTLIKCTARHITWPHWIAGNPDLPPLVRDMVESMSPGWNKQIYPFLLDGHRGHNVDSLEATENWFEAKTAMNRLRVKIQSAERRLPEEVEIVDKVRYFFCDPPRLAEYCEASCLGHYRSAHFDYITWRTEEGTWACVMDQPYNIVCSDFNCEICPDKRRHPWFAEDTPALQYHYVDRPPVK
ncbi:uncharacterized protein EHS24_004036 [Apiotrichum porosum]|uniref:Uncharacterized protein n=1 Tax=Apiotrichum porosum TaxID=105984 RepID=A0A427Y435_9TREE|nr:uncharacterized protein EHS24_004036 [Apiotrichum porosum]RSH85856.1 hypothetical protein EHS24_004036 [Apiotrichum porosum]